MTRATALLMFALAVALAPAAPAADEATVAFVNGRAAYENGEYDKAVSAWERAAGLGHAEAAFRLGAMLESGKGVPADLEAALQWYRQAAARGSRKAMFNLGHLYAKGDGVERDEAAAAGWYRRAAELGNPHAQYTLGLMYSQGRGVERDLVQAYAWLTVAIHNLDPTMFRDNANEARREIAGRMSDAQRTEAEGLLDQWASARD